jgi:hypothetical protein
VQIGSSLFPITTPSTRIGESVATDETTAKLQEIATNIGEILNTLQELKGKVDQLFDSVGNKEQTSSGETPPAPPSETSGGSEAPAGGGVAEPANPEGEPGTAT